MNLEQFISEYGNHVKSYKQLDNGVIRFKFEDKGEIMWLKGLIAQKLDLSVKTATVGKTYWFE